MAQREDTIDIDALLNRIFRESRLQDLEVQDVVREIDTPTTTSESDDEPTVTQDGEWNVAQRFLNTTVTPSIQCEYSALYNDPAYQRRARLKLHNAKESFRIRTRQDTITVMDSQYYRDTLVHLYQKYPITGGREDLYPLVALYMIDLEENGIYADDSNDSGDDDNDDGNNDDGDNGDGDNGDQDEDDKKNTKTQNKRQHSGDIIMNFSIKIKRYKWFFI